LFINEKQESKKVQRNRKYLATNSFGKHRRHTMTEPIMGNGVPIVATQLVRNFGETIAVNQLSFEVQAGEIYGLLGPNGAGKTTTVRMVSGLLPPTVGQVQVFGYDPMTQPIEVKKRIGLVPEDHILYESLTPREFFNFVASVRRLDQSAVENRMLSLIDAFEFAEYYDKPIATLSHGNRQKASIMSALIHDPPLLVLDEPFSGLDARTVRVLKDILNIHLENGGGILFSSHILEVAESLCNRIGIIDEGRMVAEGTVNELREMVKSHGSLEEVFLRAVQQDEEVAETVKALRRALAKNNNL
jgi:ABC-2 type transport system ATP-binding protein